MPRSGEHGGSRQPFIRDDFECFPQITPHPTRPRSCALVLASSDIICALLITVIRVRAELWLVSIAEPIWRRSLPIAMRPLWL
jgi:hypothetical protein